MSRLRCAVCQRPSGGRLCDDPACERANETVRQNYQRRAGATPRLRIAGTADDTRVVPRHTRAEPVVMYGLLTASDVAELERRRALLERRRRVATLMIAAAETIPNDSPEVPGRSIG